MRGKEQPQNLDSNVSANYDVNPSDDASCVLPFPARDQVAALRMLDANLNRALEGLRVVEDYCRFALSDAHLTRRCKELRHNLVSALAKVSATALVAARDSSSDVGAEISTPQEGKRECLEHVAAASWQRVQQAMRVIDECLKLVAPNAAAAIEALRYQTYTLAKAFLITTESCQRLANARLHVLLDGGSSESSFLRRVKSLIAVGVPILQLRDKRLSDRKVLSRGKMLRELIDESAAETLFIMNDRADLAALSRADGVHIGQDELTVKDARRIVGPSAMIGVSTHNIDQARQAVLDGANYIGCGPTFPSQTKDFDRFPGLEYLRKVADEISLPAFAIGGIDEDNVQQVLSTGFTRIAVGSAVMSADDRSGAARSLLALLSDKASAKAQPKAQA